MTTLTNAKAFKGILQYKSTDNFTKETGYVYFIREFNEKNEETGNAEIYFGNRKYGDVNVSQLSEIESILERIDELAQEIESKQDVISDLATIRSGASKGATAVQPGSLSTVATSGSYNDLSNKPTIASAVTINGVNKTISSNKINIGTIPTAVTINNSTKTGSTIDLGKVVTGISVNSSAKTVTNGNVDLGTVVTGVTMNGSAKTVSDGKVDLGTIITAHQTLKTINNQSIVGSGNIIAGDITAEDDDSLSLDDVNTNTYVKYVAQTLTEEQKAQVRTNIGVGEGGGTNITEQTIIDWGFTKNTGTYSKPSAGIPKTDLASAVQTSLGLADTSIQSKIVTSTVRTGTVNISANTMTHLTSGLTGSTTIKITHQTVTSDAEWGVKFFINGTTVPSITFASSSTSYPIAWINNTAPSFETGYMYEVTFKQFNNKYLAVCGKFKI